MRRVFNFAAISLVLAYVSAASAETTVLKSVAELRKLGISVERLRHDTPMASMEIGSLVESGKSGGEYDHTECVVLSEVVDPERLPLADAETLDSVKVVRRNESSKTRSIFLVTGKDLPRTYLAFQFNAREGEASKNIRYLFPIGQIIGNKR